MNQHLWYSIPRLALARARASLLGLVIGSIVAGCAVNPVTGERELALISEEQEISMGGEASQQVAQSLGLSLIHI